MESFEELVKKEFLEEATDFIEEIEQILFQFESNKAFGPDINNLFRFVHTLKGSGMCAGIDCFAEINHPFEQIIENIRDLNIPYSDRLIQCFLDTNQANRNAIDVLKEDLDANINASEINAMLNKLLDELTGKIDNQATISIVDVSEKIENTLPQKSSDQDRSNITILLVEDDPDVREFIVESLLEIYNYSITEAVNGKEGLEFYRNNVPDLLITDLKMPEMSGLELIREIRKEDHKTPIIVASGFGDRDEMIELIELGISKFINKLQPDSLVAQVNESLKSALLRIKMKELAKKNFTLFVKTNNIVQILETKLHFNDAILDRNLEELKLIMEDISELTGSGLNIE